MLDSFSARLGVRGLFCSTEVSLGRAPFLRPLRHPQRVASLVRGHLRYYGPVRLPAVRASPSCSLGFTARASGAIFSPRPNGGISRFLLARLVYVRGVYDHAGPDQALAIALLVHVAFRSMRGRRHPDCVFSRLNIPARIPPVNASRTPCGRLAHDSGLSGSLFLSHRGLAPPVSRQF